MIAAEELGLSMEQVTRGAGRHERLALGFHRREHVDLDRDGSTSMRGAAAAARTLLLNLASAQLGVPVG